VVLLLLSLLLLLLLLPVTRPSGRSDPLACSTSTAKSFDSIKSVAVQIRAMIRDHRVEKKRKTAPAAPTNWRGRARH
jgi:hypothetical protein